MKLFFVDKNVRKKVEEKYPSPSSSDCNEEHMDKITVSKFNTPIYFYIMVNIQ